MIYTIFQHVLKFYPPCHLNLQMQDGLVFDEDGRTASFENLRVVFREPHLVGSLVSKWDLQAGYVLGMRDGRR